MVTNTARSPLAPEVPTPQEAGFPELTFNGVNGIYGWRDMPESLKARIAADIREIATDPAVAARLQAHRRDDAAGQRRRVRRGDRGAARQGRHGGAGGRGDEVAERQQAIARGRPLTPAGSSPPSKAWRCGRRSSAMNLREELRALGGRLDAERGESAFAAEVLHRVVDPAVDRLRQLGRQAGRSPHAPTRRRNRAPAGRARSSSGSRARARFASCWSPRPRARCRRAPSAAATGSPRSSSAHGRRRRRSPPARCRDRR